MEDSTSGFHYGRKNVMLFEFLISSVIYEYILLNCIAVCIISLFLMDFVE